MNLSSLSISAALVVFGISTAVQAAGDSAPVLVWSEQGPGIAQGGGSSGNVYYGGGVFNDSFYTGQLNYGPMAYARLQSGGPATALIHQYCSAVPPTSYNGARSTVAIGDYIYYNRTDKPSGYTSPRVNRLNSDWTHDVPYDLNANNGDVAPEGMTTDGMHLYTSLYPSGKRNILRKYSVSNDASSFTLTKMLPDIVIAEATMFRALSYHEGSLYAVDIETGSPYSTNRGIYEANASTGAWNRIGSHIGFGGYQAVRYGDRVFVVGLDDMLTVYNVAGGALSSGTSYDLGLGDLYGLGVVGGQANPTGFWVTSVNGWVSYFSFTLCNQPAVDVDADKDVDMDDFGAFQSCYGRLIGDVQSGYPCRCFDLDSSLTIDDTDFGAFKRCATGAAVQWTSSDDCP